MLQINFHPDSDARDYSKEIARFDKIWTEEGEKIVSKLKELLQMDLPEKVINAIVVNGKFAFSTPLNVGADIPEEFIKGTLAHELIHRFFVANKIHLKRDKDFTENVHKLLDLVLYDALIDLYKENYAKLLVDFEINLAHAIPYKNAWNWALAMTREERAIKFKELVKEYQVK